MENTTGNPQNVVQSGAATSQPAPSTIVATPESKAPINIAGYYDQQTWAVMKMMGQTFLAAKAFPTSIQNIEQMMTILQAGREMGLKPIESLSYIALIKGRPSLWGDKAIEMVISAGHRVEWSTCNDKTATCTITRGDTAASMTATFTIEMATARGFLAKGGPWVSSPENMLKFKAFHMIAKFLVPDALRSMGVAEIDDAEIPPTVINNVTVTNSPNMSAQQANIAQTPTTEAPAAEEPKSTSLADRVKKRAEEIENYKKLKDAQKSPKAKAPAANAAIEGEVIEAATTTPKDEKIVITEAKGTTEEEDELIPEEIIPPVESDAVKKMKRLAKDAQEKVQSEVPEPRSPGAEFHYKRLIDEELGGRKLSKDEVQWISKYNAANKS